MSKVIYTIGHSNMEVEVFLGLLKSNDITAVADVRSHPYSRYVEHFNRENLQKELKSAGIEYVFMGEELGARQDDASLYDSSGKIDFDRVEKADFFLSGIERVLEGAKKYTIALMCSEKNPLDCHRTHLVARHLVKRDFLVSHILENGTQKNHVDLVADTVRQGDFLRSDEETLHQTKGHEIAYKIVKH